MKTAVFTQKSAGLYRSVGAAMTQFALAAVLIALTGSFGIASAKPVRADAKKATSPIASPKLAPTKKLAAVPTRLLTLRTFAEWKALPKKEQQLYLLGVQEMMASLASIDQDAHVEYQTASADGATSRALKALIPFADAEASDKESPRTCVYAGWVSQFDINGRYCMHPPQGDCKGHQVQCQPLLYGAGLCVAAGRSATQACTKNAKPLAEIVKDVATREEDWNQFRQELTDACQSPKQTQVRVCGNLRERLAQIENLLSSTKTSTIAIRPAPAATAGQRSTASLAKSKSSDDTQTVVVAPAAQAVSSDDVDSSENADVSNGRSRKKLGANDSCELDKLIYPLDTYRPGREALEAVTIMTLAEAQALVCSSDAIQEETIAARRRTIQRYAQIAERGSGHYVKNAREIARKYLENFDSCVAAARSARERDVTLTDSGGSSIVRYVGDVMVEIKLSKRSQPRTTQAAYIGMELHNEGLSVCGASIDSSGGGDDGGSSGGSFGVRSDSAQ